MMDALKQAAQEALVSIADTARRAAEAIATFVQDSVEAAERVENEQLHKRL